MSSGSLLLYYITDGRQWEGTQAERRTRLLKKIAEAVEVGVDFVQVREKDLTTRELERLAREAMGEIKRSSGRTRLLLNSRVDVALAVGAHGVHLRSRDISAQEVRRIWKLAKGAGAPVITISCHTEKQVEESAQAQADYALLAPIFAKAGSSRVLGLELLHRASRHPIPILALGGIGVENARSCIQAGATGIAAIRLFQNNPLKQIIPQLRS
ncbi:MAG: thiamine phosphate synthase [Acidobacteria bacterium]|nr:thiamine phosphate synthase [Acidobacteriota bacterium]